MDFQSRSKSSVWLDRIARARTARTDCEEDWDENRSMLNSVSYTDRASKYDRVWVNHMLSLTRIVVPLLYYKNPQFVGLPCREQDERSYKVAEEAVNYWARVIGLKHPAKEAILDSLVASFGCIKVGWIVDQTDLRVKLHPDGTKEIIDDSVDLPQSTVQTQLVQAGVGSRPFTVRVSPWNLLRNVGSTSIKNASWVAERVFRRVEEVKADPLYKNAAKIKPNATTMSQGMGTVGNTSLTMDRGADDVSAARALADPDDQLVELWEVWDRSNVNKPMQYVFCEGVDEPLLEREWPYDLDGRFPYIELRLIDVPDEPYPISFLSAVKELIRELNIISTYELDFVKRSTPKVAYDKTVVTDEADLQALRRGEPAATVGVTGDPNRAFSNIGGAQMNPDLKWVHLKAQEDLQLISGIADFMRGGSSNPDELATVANIRTQALSMMVQDMMDRVSDALLEWVRDVDAMAKEYADKPTMIRITGKTGFQWQSFSKADLQGQYEYQIVPGSLQPINKEVELKQRLDLLNLLAPFAPPGSTQVNLKELIRSIGEMSQIKHMDKILDSETPPPACDPAEENYLLQEGGSPVVSPDEDFDDHLMIHQQWEQQLLASGAPNPGLLQRLRKHIRDTTQAKMQAVIQIMMQQQQAAMAMQGGMPTGGPAGGPGGGAGGPPPSGPPRVPGNGGPAQNGPIRPRLMSEAQPDTGHMLAGANRRNPEFPQR